MYLFLFTGIGYIAFWEQDFNDPDKFLFKYELLREKHIEVLRNVGVEMESEKALTEFNANLNEYMKSANDAAGDLQELASQSFNIVLGAILAFLSATATTIFQGSIRQKDDSEQGPTGTSEQKS